MTGLVVYLVLFLAGLSWGLWTGFGDALFAPEGPAGRTRADGDLKSTFAAAFATGFGGSGATLTHAARWGPGASLGCALLTGILFATLVTLVAKIVLDEERRLTSP